MPTPKIMDMFYVSHRLGKNRVPIKIYKLRTMVLDADKQLEMLVNTSYTNQGKILNDPRITPLGKIIRRYGIDEIPQLYNLINGDLKLVGIRPIDEDNWRKYPKDIMDRALMQKPAYMGIQYAYPVSNNFNDGLRQMDEYLTKYDKDPLGTDFDYFRKIIYNVIFNGVRSS